MNAEDNASVGQRLEEAETGLSHNFFAVFWIHISTGKKTQKNCYGNSLVREMSSRGPASRHVHYEHGSFVCWYPSKEELKYGMWTLVSKLSEL